MKGAPKSAQLRYPIYWCIERADRRQGHVSARLFIEHMRVPNHLTRILPSFIHTYVHVSFCELRNLLMREKQKYLGSCLHLRSFLENATHGISSRIRMKQCAQNNPMELENQRRARALNPRFPYHYSLVSLELEKHKKGGRDQIRYLIAQ